jgi:hypothetical protein
MSGAVEIAVTTAEQEVSETTTETSPVIHIIVTEPAPETQTLSILEAPPGASACEIAVAEGFEGTQAEWLAALVGDDGIDGTDGQSVTITYVSTEAAYEAEVAAAGAFDIVVLEA